MTEHETVDLYVIARLDDDGNVAIADLFTTELFFTTDGALDGRGVGSWWESVSTAQGEAVTLEALDGALATCGYVRIGEWRERVTNSGNTRFFADAVTRLEALNS
ncbi:hypothetical protein [Nocardia alba]|uniref:Uncharacterized protein n=1 Tax=Nocardia alba TaxID=225051 RepID=A0A4R1F1V4_9NOCA|nr:hypothetical protein [Nocardia alba]TCJ88116.1 hypothetical protein DFR71_6658 [Nocardia alba]